MRGLNLLSCGVILVSLLLVSGTVSGLRNVPTPTIDTADIEAFHSIDKAAQSIYAGQNALQSGRYEEALEQYTIATESDPSWLAAWYLKGYSLEKLNRSEEALTAVDKALSLDPTDRDSNNLKADILEHLGRTKDAVQYRNTAISSDTTASPTRTPEPTRASPLHPAIIVLGVLGGVWIAGCISGYSHSDLNRKKKR